MELQITSIRDVRVFWTAVLHLSLLVFLVIAEHSALHLLVARNDWLVAVGAAGLIAWLLATKPRSLSR